MGEFLIGTYLEKHLDESQAAQAAEGWGGDRYSLLSGPEGERLLVVLIMWDSFQESSEFFDIYQVYVGVKTQGTEVSAKRGSAGRKWVTADETTFLGNTGPATLLIIGDDEKNVDTALQQITEALQDPIP
jgi:hypothetical protein